MNDINILVLDNYDSFTYNIVHYIEEITGREPDVFRNDKISIGDIERYDAIVLSPGPGIPDEAGILKEVISTYAGKKPIFGVCLGLQAIVEVFGGQLENMEEVYHGIATDMHLKTDDSVTFRGIPTVFEAARYHSWIASKNNFPKDLTITCEDEFGKIMAIQHREYPIEAVQFHPESILTPHGKQMLENFISSVKS